MRSFNALGGPPSLLRNMRSLGLGRPTPLQSHAVPVVAAGSDLLACAPRGSGLTTALLLPLAQRLLCVSRPRPAANRAYPAALVVCPTRELAERPRPRRRPCARGRTCASL